MKVLFIFLSLYWLPGYFASGFFSGPLKRSLFFHLFLSFLIVPIIYLVLIVLGRVNLTTFVLAEVLFAGLCWFWQRKLNSQDKINTQELFPDFKLSLAMLFTSVSFFFLVMSPRLGLWQGFLPIGDDQHQVRKVVSIAVSPAEPLFYHFPITRLTIYYFNNVAPGLAVKFSQNSIKAHQAWFIHAGLQTALLLWLLVRIGGSLFSSNSARWLFLFFTTYFSGLEYYLYKIKGLAYLDQLEWWSDWILSQSKIHLQVTNPYNLFFWVPQHLLAALLVLVIYTFLRSREKQKLLSQVFLALIWSSLLGNSAFVFLPTLLVYLLYLLSRLLKGDSLAKLAGFNLPVLVLALIFSYKNLELFLTSEKGHYFVSMANVFWFVSNSTFWGKIVNFSLTIPLYLLIEFGVLSVVLVWAAAKFVKDKQFREKYLFFYFFLFLFPIIFVIKALDDNNISMRSFIPMQLGLAIFAAEMFVAIGRKRVLFFILLAGLILSLPTGLSDFYRRFSEQFGAASLAEFAFFRSLDESLPLNSVIFSPVGYEDKVTVLGHRFTFKPVASFSATDREHTAASQVAFYQDYDFGARGRLLNLLRRRRELGKDFNLYALAEVDLKDWGTTQKVLSRGNFSIYALKVKP